MMTKVEVAVKNLLLDMLNKQGYPTYSRLLDKFHINLTSDPKVIAYMEPGKGRIVINRGLDLEQVSMIVRHEILHEYLSHQIRAERHVGADKWKNRSGIEHDAFNRAADYEISNRGYTDADKVTARSIRLNGETLTGLVTDIDHPEWVNMSMEEMYDELSKELEDMKNEAQSRMTQIGDKGDQATQDAEDAQREANAIIDDADEIIESSDSSEEEKEEAKEAKAKAQQAKDELDEIEDELDEVDADGDGKINDGEEEAKPFDPEKERKIAKAQARIQGIQDDLADARLGQRIQDETEDAIENEKRIKAAQDAQKYRQNPLSQFVDSLNQFIRKATGVGRGKSYGKINKTYANSSIIKAGTSRRVENKVPLLNVYFDVSASWDESKIKIGRQGIATLNQYVRQGKLKINVYYFSDYVSGDRAEVEGGSTEALPHIFNHIRQTKADNVIVMTDGDMERQGGSVSPLTVPGGVWLLFVGKECERLKANLKGHQLTKSIFIKG